MQNAFSLFLKLQPFPSSCEVSNIDLTLCALTLCLQPVIENYSSSIQQLHLLPNLSKNEILYQCVCFFHEKLNSLKALLQSYYRTEWWCSFSLYDQVSLRPPLTKDIDKHKMQQLHTQPQQWTVSQQVVFQRTMTLQQNQARKRSRSAPSVIQITDKVTVNICHQVLVASSIFVQNTQFSCTFKVPQYSFCCKPVRFSWTRHESTNETYSIH